jgi:hypothetical protein
MTDKTLSALGLDPNDNPDRFKNSAPYWRFAYEHNWDQHSLMIGTYGMLAEIFPGNVRDSGTDRITDVGIDAQYQYIGDIHGVTARVNYIKEWQKRDASIALGSADNYKNFLNSFKASATYYYEPPRLNGQKFGFSAGYFTLNGSSDATLYGTFSGSPNSQGWVGEVNWMPFNRGGPGLWPWLNTRIGLQYIAYTKFDGAKDDIDGTGRKASANNTLYFYIWTAF